VALFSILPANYKERFQTLNVFFASQNQYAINQDSSFVNRRNELLAGLTMFQDHPLFGVGLTNYSANYYEYAGRLGLTGSSENARGETEKFAHSLYVEILAELGLAGFITFSIFFILLFVALIEARRKYERFIQHSDWAARLTALFFSLVTFLVSGLFLHGLLFRYIWMLVGFSMAGIAINKDLVKTLQARSQPKRKHLHS
jgi:O-antigen ligase